jgi:hypothetical protein
MEKQLTISKFPTLSKEYFIKPINRWIKPTGGLWSSTYTPNNKYISGWHEFCSIEFETGIANSPYKIIFDISKNARIYTINSQEDLISLIDNYGYYLDQATKVLEELGTKPTYLCLDFENLAKHFDVIHLTEEGQWRTRMPLKNMAYNLYGWDVESSLILNINVIKNQKVIQ